jgi:hypothetical protein
MVDRLSQVSARNFTTFKNVLTIRHEMDKEYSSLYIDGGNVQWDWRIRVKYLEINYISPDLIIYNIDAEAFYTVI